MRIKILNDGKNPWLFLESSGSRVYFRGAFWWRGEFFESSGACLKLKTIVEPLLEQGRTAGLAGAIARMRGNFSFVADSPYFLLAAADRVRSYPVYYAFANETFYLGNSSRRLQQEAGLFKRDALCALEFAMAGYVTGPDTLYEGISQVQAGEFLLFSKTDGSLTRSDYYRYWSDSLDYRPDKELAEDLRLATEEAMRRAILSLGKRPVWIPLSGGLDSRLLLACFLYFGYPDITAFSYGKRGHPEVARARRIARKLGVKWHNVEYRPRQVRAMYLSAERKEYFSFADGLSSVPFLNDFYALWLLRQRGLIPADAVFINGQTGDFITGGHLPEAFRVRQEWSGKDLAEAIIDKHFSLWVNLKTEDNLQKISRKILSQLGLCQDSRFGNQEAARYFEFWEWRERQSKFVVNGQRVYEWFGYGWRLPFWDAGLMDFWSRMPLEAKLGQRLHKRFLNSVNYGGVFNGYYMGPHPVKAWERAAVRLLAFYSFFSGKDLNMLANKYVRYFGNYSPFYSYIPYRQYLKDAYWHRNLISYLAREILEGIPK